MVFDDDYLKCIQFLYSQVHYMWHNVIGTIPIKYLSQTYTCNLKPNIFILPNT